MIDVIQTSNGVSHLARQTTDMAPVTVETTVDPLAFSNIARSDIVYVERLVIEVLPQIVLVEKV